MGKKVVLDPETLSNIVQQYQDGVSADHLSKVLKVSAPTMRRILRDAGCTIRPASSSNRKIRPVAGVIGLMETSEQKEKKVNELKKRHETARTNAEVGATHKTEVAKHISTEESDADNTDTTILEW